MNRLMAGAVAGAAATVPMTALMRAWHAELPERERYPLPPERITDRAATAVGMDSRPERPGWEWKAYAAHFGFGATAGAACAALAAGIPAPPAAKGAALGIGVWAVSYLGWLPAVGLHPPATKEPTGRNLLMLAAHVVWGATAGALAERLASGADEA